MSSAEYFSDYYQANRTRIRERQAIAYQANREERIRSASAYKLLKRIARPVMFSSGRNSVYQKRTLTDDPCAYCGGASTGVDHIVPRAAGGVDDFTNITGACVKCNRRKSTTSLLHFLLEQTA